MQFFNPLEAVKKQEPESTSSVEGVESTSALFENNTHGSCPKCSGQMAIVAVSPKEDAYHCAKCRVTNPLPKSV